MRLDIEKTVVKGSKSFKDALEFELVFEMSYLNLVFQEALRFYPVAQFCAPLEILEDTILKPNLHVKKGDTLMVNIHGIHHNPHQWQKPKEFIPERFDPESEFYLTPDGKKRETTSYMPFSVGRRSCFGKTFAEVIGRTTAAMLLEAFDFTFDDPDFMNYTPAMGVSSSVEFKPYYHIKIHKS